MSFATTAMVMAAGMGKRMRPLTASMPKPLVKLAGKPLINHCFDQLAAGGIKKLVVNVHYRADLLEAHLAKMASQYPFEIIVSDERAQLMETGGGLVQAHKLIDEDVFFCINSDNIWFDSVHNMFDDLRDNWLETEMDALLQLVSHKYAHNHRGPGDFHLDSQGHISRRKEGRQAPFIFTGLQLLSSRLLREPPSGPFSTNIFWQRAIEERCLQGLAFEGEWFDVGNPQALKSTEEALSIV